MCVRIELRDESASDGDDEGGGDDWLQNGVISHFACASSIYLNALN